MAAWQNSFLIALGEFDENLEFYREIDWLVFLICCFFNMIVMLNLLIAIISETFANIAAEQVNNTYKEKARQVSIIQDTLLGLFKKQPNPNELCFIAKTMSSVDILEDDADQLEVITQGITQINKKMNELIN